MSIKQLVFLMSVFILSHFSLFAVEVVIIESQSFNSMQRMDENWAEIANSMGYTSAIYTQDELTDANLGDARLIIVSSGLATISDHLSNLIVQFVRSGGMAYIQSEYQISNPGNQLFEYCVNNMGGQFNWAGETMGSLVPMEMSEPLSNNLNTTVEANYFWFGTYGTGDETIQPLMEHEGNHYGFLFDSENPAYGNIFTCSDQDWIRTFQNPSLMENIIYLLLEVEVIPNISIASSNDAPCVEEPVSFTATLDDYEDNYIIEWFVNGELQASSSSLEFTIEAPESGMIVQANVVVDAGQNVSNEIELLILQPLGELSLDITSNTHNICENETVSFTANHAGTEFAGNVALQWMINGSAVALATQENFSSNNLQNGDVINCQLSYDDICTVNNMVQSNEIEIEVNSITTPDVIIEADVLAICSGETVSFSATGANWGNDPVFQWTVEGNPVGENQATYNSSSLQAGQLVACQVTSSNVCASTPTVSSQHLSIQVAEILTPTLELSADQLTVCSGQSVQIHATGTNWGNEPVFQWTLDGAIIENNSDVLTLTVPLDGQTIGLTLTSSLNCLDQAQVLVAPISVQVVETLSPTISVAADQENPCFGSSVTFAATGEHWGDNPQIQWFVDGVATQENQSTFSLENIQQLHQVKCVVTTDLNCSDNNAVSSEALFIGANNFTLNLVEARDANCGESDGTIIIDATGGIEPYSFAWSNGEFGNKIENLSGNTYEVLATDSTGCTQELSITIKGGELPVILGVETADTQCGKNDGWAEAIVANESEDYTYKWRYQDGKIVSEAAVAENLEAGLYELIVAKGEDCVSSHSLAIYANTADLFVELDNDSVRINQGEKYGLMTSTNLGSDAIYQWSPTKGLACTDCQNTAASPETTTTYTVLVSTPDGCTVSDTVTVYVDAPQEIYVPNVFSPNNDGNNDYFMAFGSANAGSIKSITVFNRSGGIVFDKRDMQLNDESEGWDGTTRGKKAAPGVYVYIVNIQFSDGTSRSYQGDISLL